MAIRFHCSLCGRPIEIDDEWASKLVACPFCRNTVTAPPASTLTDTLEVPAASPLSAGGYSPAIEVNATGRGGSNHLAVIALVLACCGLAMSIGAQLVMSAHHSELEELSKTYVQGAKWAEIQQAQFEYFEKSGGFPAWLGVLTVLTLGSGLLWLAGLTCSLLALRRPSRRRLTIASLMMIVAMPLFFCCGGVFGPSG